MEELKLRDGYLLGARLRVLAEMRRRGISSSELATLLGYKGFWGLDAVLDSSKRISPRAYQRLLDWLAEEPEETVAEVIAEPEESIAEVAEPIAEPTTALARVDEAPLVLAGQAADRAAARGVFADYRQRKAGQTLRAQDADLALFARFLQAAGVPVESLHEPEAWRGVSWGLVAAFVRWLVDEGHAVASVNRTLATVKTYAKLAAQAGAVTTEALALIKTVAGYSAKEGKRLDEGRQTSRKGRKKAEAVSISREWAHKLKSQIDTPQGARDQLLMCILLDHGLRVGEVAGLQWSNVDVAGEYLTFYRSKVDKTQIIKLSKDTRRALERYRAHVEIYQGPLLRASDKAGRLLDHGMTTGGIAQRVRSLGAAAGVEGLSPHDCRHYWATVLTRKGASIKALQDAGGWSSPAMPLRYAESTRIANEGAEVD